MGFGGAVDKGEWRLWKYVEEPEFGPPPPVQTVFVMGTLGAGNQSSQGYSSPCYFLLHLHASYEILDMDLSLFVMIFTIFFFFGSNSKISRKLFLFRLPIVFIYVRI